MKETLQDLYALLLALRDREDVPCDLKSHAVGLIGPLVNAIQKESTTCPSTLKSSEKPSGSVESDSK